METPPPDVPDEGAFVFGARAQTPRPETKRRFPIFPVLVSVLLLATLAVLGVTYGELRSQRADVQETADRLGSIQRSIFRQDQRLAEAVDRIGELEASSPAGVAAIVRRVRAAVYTVETGSITTGGQGTAFAVQTSRGQTTLITNYHVVAAAWEAGDRDASVRRGGRKRTGRIVEVSVRGDLAAIVVEALVPTLPVRRQAPAVGDTVIAVGSPYGLGGSVSTGVVSSLRGGFIQFTAPISPGSSGSPLIDSAGRVVGVSVSKVVGFGAEGLSFAIPTRTLCRTVLDC